MAGVPSAGWVAAHPPQTRQCGLQVPDGCQEISAGGKLVMPGGIDPHTHLTMPFMGAVAVDDFFRCVLRIVKGLHAHVFTNTTAIAPRAHDATCANRLSAATKCLGIRGMNLQFARSYLRMAAMLQAANAICHAFCEHALTASMFALVQRAGSSPGGRHHNAHRLCAACRW